MSIKDIFDKMQQEPTYDELVNKYIRQKYSQSEEFAILRQRDTKPKEFESYNRYCEMCKRRAKLQ